jgi:hypothetical protein
MQQDQRAARRRAGRVDLRDQEVASREVREAADQTKEKMRAAFAGLKKISASLRPREGGASR